MGWQHGRYHGLGMNALVNGWVGSMDVIMVWAWMHWPMDALASGCLGSMDVIMVWARMRSPVDALVAWTLSWFGHGCTGQWMPW